MRLTSIIAAVLAASMLSGHAHARNTPYKATAAQRVEAPWLDSRGRLPTIVLKILCTPDRVPFDDPNPVVRTYITEIADADDNPVLQVVHELADGTSRNRGVQYEFTGVSFKPEADHNYKMIWNGRLRSDRRTRIVGTISHGDGDDLTYVESWFELDRKRSVPPPNDMRGYKFTNSESHTCRLVDRWDNPNRGQTR